MNDRRSQTHLEHTSKQEKKMIGAFQMLLKKSIVEYTREINLGILGLLAKDESSNRLLLTDLAGCKDLVI